MGLAHRLFGIRSCNEVITGQRGRPCLEYDIKRCIAPCVAEICSRGTVWSGGGEHEAAARRAQRRARSTRCASGWWTRPSGSGSRRPRSCATRCGPCRSLRDRQQKVATAQLGDRDVFGLKVGPSGGAIQVFAMRGGRVVERVELVTDPAASRARDADVLQAALQQFYEMRVAAGRDRPAAGHRGLRGDGGVAVVARRPPREDSRAAARRQARARRAGDAQRGAVVPHALQREHAAHFDALETLRSRARAARPFRAGSNASTSRRFRAARPSRRWSCAKTAG